MTFLIQSSKFKIQNRLNLRVVSNYSQVFLDREFKEFSEFSEFKDFPQSPLTPIIPIILIIP